MWPEYPCTIIETILQAEWKSNIYHFICLSAMENNT